MHARTRPPRRHGDIPRYLTRRQTVALLEEAARAVAAAPAGEVTPAAVATTLVGALRRVGVHPAIVHAFVQTGMLVSADNLDLWGPAETARWGEALEAWRASCPEAPVAAAVGGPGARTRRGGRRGPLRRSR